MSRLTADQNTQLIIVSAFILLGGLVWAFFTFIYRPTEEDRDEKKEGTKEGTKEGKKEPGEKKENKENKEKKIEPPIEVSFREKVESNPTLFFPPEEVPIPLPEWLGRVNRKADENPHLGVEGPTGVGKTTTARVILADRSLEAASSHIITVLTAKQGDEWFPLQAIGIDNDLTYTSIDREAEGLLVELKRRLALGESEEKSRLPELTILVDDFTILSKECPNLALLIRKVLIIGRSLKIRLILLADTFLTKPLGIEGEGEIRKHFRMIRFRGRGKAYLEEPESRGRISLMGVKDLAEKLIIRAETVRFSSEDKDNNQTSPSDNLKSDNPPTQDRWLRALKMVSEGVLTQAEIAQEAKVSLTFVNQMNKIVNDS